MSISISNLLGKAASIYERGQTALNYSKEGNASLKDFIQILAKYGTIVNCRYEASFSGITDFTFFVTSLAVPSIKRNFTSLMYEGQGVEVPQTIEFEHDFNVTILNDGEGYIYSTISNWLLTVGGDSLLDSGFTMTLRMLGDGVNDNGLTIQFNGVRFKNISGLQVSNTDTGISTFTVACSAINYTVVAGKLTKVAGVSGIVKDVYGYVSSLFK